MNWKKLIFVWFSLLAASLAGAQEITVSARVAWQKGNRRDISNVVIWLKPEGATPPAMPNSAQKPRLTQKNKSFDPHVLVVPVGSVVEFPNRDPFFHNVFSLFDGKRFDLGLYEAGSSRDVHFDKPGISYIFCNIHPEMSAVVIALDTPYYAVSDSRGQIVIPNVPQGRYQLKIWYEGVQPEALKAMEREVDVSEESATVGVLRLLDPGLVQGHKNLYGREYDSSSPAGSVYPKP